MLLKENKNRSSESYENSSKGEVFQRRQRTNFGLFPKLNSTPWSSQTVNLIAGLKWLLQPEIIILSHR